MAVNLQKGQKIDLKKNDGSELNKLMVGLGWDQADRGSRIDCDASVILCGADGKVINGGDKSCCIYFGNKKNANKSIVHSGDNLTGAGAGDDEQINVSLPDLPPDIERLIFIVNIFNADKRGQHFGGIQNAFIRIVDKDNNTELCKYNLSANYNNMTGLIAGEIYKRNGSWKFNAIGEGVLVASKVNDIINLYR